MKIVRVETLALRAELRGWLFVEIETDAGLVGIGEASQSRNDQGVRECIDQLRPHLVGRDPRDLIEPLQYALLRDPFAGRVRYAAHSALDHALWDLSGKAAGLPCHRLFGGAVRDRVRLYANIVIAAGGLEPAALARAAAAAVEEGFTAVKFNPLGGFGLAARVPAPALSAETERAVIARLSEVRQAIGPDVDLLLDWSWLLTRKEAEHFLPRLEDFAPYWHEEPFPYTDPEALAELRPRLGCRLAAGEQLQGRRAMMALMAANAVDVLMPDVKWIGGLTEARKIAAIAEAHTIEVSPHNMSGPVATAASLQLAATTGAATLLEYCWGNTPWRADLVGGAERIEAGHLVLSEAPGLGLDWSREVALRHTAPSAG